MEGMGEIINVAAYVSRSSSYGPGIRAVLWVQGCERKCPNCCNSDMWEPEMGTKLPIKEIAAKIIGDEEVEGITFSGGEPFDQAESLSLLGKEIRKAGRNILIFTGYTWKEIQDEISQKRKKGSAWQNLLENTDLIVTGPYQKEYPCQEYLRASENQEIIFITDVLKGHPDFQKKGKSIIR